mgnify:CR=1 FL=1
MEGLVPQGIATYGVPGQPAVEDYTFVLLPDLSMNAFSAAIEPLRIANQLTGKELFRWRLISEGGAPVRCSNGVALGVDGALEDLPGESIALVCSGIRAEAGNARAVPALIRKHWRRGAMVGGICTGAYTLARAGILKGSQFTLHWENLPAFRELFPGLEPGEQIYAMDGRIWTCAGGAAASDMMIHRIAALHGTGLARSVANMCLLQVPRAAQEAQKASTAAATGVRHPKLLRILKHFEENLAEEMNLDTVGAQYGISRRQMERLFRAHLSVTPKKHLLTMRLHHARAMMAGTDLTPSEVAAACGFGSSSHFSRLFKAAFGQSPKRYSMPQA